MPPHRIPGIVGATEPSFRTGDRRWMGLDTLVWETLSKLEERGHELNPVVVKAAVQVARMLVSGPAAPQGLALVQAVTEQLHHRRVILPVATVREILLAYLGVIADLEIQEINEIV